jgi:hypothetical protein
MSRRHQTPRTLRAAVETVRSTDFERLVEEIDELARKHTTTCERRNASERNVRHHIA